MPLHVPNGKRVMAPLIPDFRIRCKPVGWGGDGWLGPRAGTDALNM